MLVFPNYAKNHASTVYKGLMTDMAASYDMGWQKRGKVHYTRLGVVLFWV